MTDFLHIRKMRLMEVGKFTKDQMAIRTNAQRGYPPFCLNQAWLQQWRAGVIVRDKMAPAAVQEVCSKAGLITDQGHNAGRVALMENCVLWRELSSVPLLGYWA